MEDYGHLCKPVSSPHVKHCHTPLNCFCCHHFVTTFHSSAIRWPNLLRAHYASNTCNISTERRRLHAQLKEYTNKEMQYTVKTLILWKFTACIRNISQTKFSLVRYYPRGTIFMEAIWNAMLELLVNLYFVERCSNQSKWLYFWQV